MKRPVRAVRVVGSGRAGGSFAGALAVAGWPVEVLDRAADHGGAAEGVDLLLLCVPDAAVAEVAGTVRPGPAVVAHCAGSLGLDVLAPHGRRASVHPLVALPTATVGAQRLRGAWFATAGDESSVAVVDDVVAALAGRAVAVPDDARTEYHAAAVVASNHLVALLGQAGRIAGAAGVPLEAFLDLARASLDNVAALGPADALTGPVSRGDWDTVRRHVAALDPDERGAYLAMVGEAARLAGRPVPDDLAAR
ncbi:MAG: DUF2520 domain-containing protein [Microthrixaceae bacterium]